MELHILKNTKYKEILLSSKSESILFKNSSPRTTHNHRGVHDGFIEVYDSVVQPIVSGGELSTRQKKYTKNIKMILHSNDIREIYIVRSQSEERMVYFPIIYIQTIHGLRRLDFSPYYLLGPPTTSRISNVPLNDRRSKEIGTDSNRYIKLKKIRFDVIDNKIKRVHVYK